jgi:CubicO group peptidase (beta-lactamase class C family)
LLVAPPAGAREAVTSVGPWQEGGWPRSSLQEQGLDPDKLAELVALIRAGEEIPDLHALLIVRHGYLVLEEYFDGWRADQLHTQQSVTKSFTSALVGIAIGRGEIRDVNEKVLDFFPGVEVKNLDDRKRAMDLEDLLTMRSGNDYDEGYSGSPHSTLNSMSRGWDRFILDRPMVREPGSKFQYDSGAPILTSAILKQRAGVHADVYADKHLFGPLGITRVKWFRNEEGHPHTGGGLDLLPRDMAKFGLLYLRAGRWGDLQVVPEAWVQESFRQRVTFDGRGHTTGYGYWWWISEPDPSGAGETAIYSARGFRAQYIFVIPEHDMAVVVTGGTRRGSDQRKPVEFLYSHILPSVTKAVP